MNKSKLFKVSIVLILVSIFLVSALPGSNKETITLTGASFQPTCDCKFRNSGTNIQVDYAPATCGFLYPLQLPDGVILEKITFFWKDSSVEHNASLSLDSSNLDGTGTNLVRISTDGYEDEPTSSFSDVSIPIDNIQYGYFISIQMPSTEGVEIYGVKIEYSVPILLFLPFIRNSGIF